MLAVNELAWIAWDTELPRTGGTNEGLRENGMLERPRDAGDAKERLERGAKPWRDAGTVEGVRVVGPGGFVELLRELAESGAGEGS